MFMNLNHNRGDTIIEVLFAITVFSLVVVGSLSIMNQGSATAQRSLEISLVRNEIDAQAEALRFLNASYVAAYQSGASNCSNHPFSPGTAAYNWREIHCKAHDSTTGVSEFGTTCYSSSIPSDDFIINTKTAAMSLLTAGMAGNFTGATTFAQVRYDSNNIKKAEGIWIEAVKPASSTDPNQTNASYIDFHIRACWDSPGQSASMTLGTIVRLYEPQN